MISPFSFARIPKIEFGAGRFSVLPDIISAYGDKALIITGGSSFRNSPKFDELAESLKARKVVFSVEKVSGEPSPDLVDSVTERYRGDGISAVVSIGGGSAMDAGKAISAMLKVDRPVANFLEGIGKESHPGIKVPFIAVPTTSGTGSEATKNAVLSHIGDNGFKKSIRHENFVPDVALIDPELMRTCPPAVTAACGMDAFVQLLESYVSVKPTPMTDALAVSGIKAAATSLVSTCGKGSGDTGVRSDMAYAALISGMTLANAGLGVIHGFASSIGGFFNIPHGVICGTLLAPATKKNIEILKKTDPDGVQLKKHARIGAILSGLPYDASKAATLCERLIDVLYEWTERLGIPILREYGVQEPDIERIVAATEIKNNAALLTKEDITEILKERI